MKAALLLIFMLIFGLTFWIPFNKKESALFLAHWLPPLNHQTSTAKDVPASERVDSSCYHAFQNFYSDQTIDIRISFGYKDSRPERFVGDRYERNAFVFYLLEPCPPHFHSCGFSRDKDDADLFLKQIKGPDGKLKNIQLRITHSSVGPDDDANRKDPLQHWQSRHAELNFLIGLTQSHAVFYNGHSRDGGGPDFSPPRITRSLTVDYYWYKIQKPGTNKMLSSLKQNPSKPKVLGLFSCDSTQQFSKQILSVQKNIALVSSDALLYYTDALINLLGSLHSLLNQSCQKDFEYTLRSGRENISSLILGFFNKPDK